LTGRKLLWEGTKAFFRGSTEEGSQQFNQNFWQWLLTDRSQKWFEGVQQAAGMGGPLETIMSGGFAAAGRVGTPVSPEEAQRRLEVIRKGVRESTLPAEMKAEILAEIDKAVEYVPEIVLGKDEAKAREEAARAEAKAKDTASRAGQGEGGQGVRDAATQTTVAAAPVPDATGAAEEVDPYDYQDAHAEKVIHSEWETGNSYRHVLEGAGDIFRELANTGGAMKGYIREDAADSLHSGRGTRRQPAPRRHGYGSAKGEIGRPDCRLRIAAGPNRRTGNGSAVSSGSQSRRLHDSRNPLRQDGVDPDEAG
jgi:hypothetical protein